MGKLAKFKRRIGAAFADLPYPGDDQIIKNIQHYEIDDLHHDFRGKHWRDINLQTAESWHNGTMLFTPAGFRYYLPAFLLADLHQNSVQIGSYLIYMFVPPDDSSGFAQFSDTMNGFTEAQKGVLTEWIRRFYKRNPPTALDRFEKTREFWGLTDET